MKQYEMYLEDYVSFLEEQLKTASEILDDVSLDSGSSSRVEAENFIRDLNQNKSMFNIRNAFTRVRGNR